MDIKTKKCFGLLPDAAAADDKGICCDWHIGIVKYIIINKTVMRRDLFLLY